VDTIQCVTLFGFCLFAGIGVACIFAKNLTLQMNLALCRFTGTPTEDLKRTPAWDAMTTILGLFAIFAAIVFLLQGNL
jgi:hypothetical protein